MLKCPQCDKPPVFMVDNGVATVGCCDLAKSFMFDYRGDQDKLVSHWNKYVKRWIDANKQCSICGVVHDRVAIKLLCEEAHRHTPPYKVGDFIRIKIWHEEYSGQDWSEIADVRINEVKMVCNQQLPRWVYVVSQEYRDDYEVEAFFHGNNGIDFTRNNPDLLELLATAEQMRPHYDKAEKIKAELSRKYNVDSEYGIDHKGCAHFKFFVSLGD